MRDWGGCRGKTKTEGAERRRATADPYGMIKKGAGMTKKRRDDKKDRSAVYFK
jgi:hypothetical protein